MLDLQYHDIRPEKGLYYLLERQGKMRAASSRDEEIERRDHAAAGGHARVFPRASACGGTATQVFGVNWDSISFGVGDEPIKRVLMAEPLKGTKAHVEELLASSPTAATWSGTCEPASRENADRRHETGASDRKRDVRDVAADEQKRSAPSGGDGGGSAQGTAPRSSPRRARS